MRRIIGGLVAGALFLANAPDARAQDAGLYQMQAPMTWGSTSVPMGYGLTSRYQGYVAPYGYGPQNSAYSNVGLGSFVNGDNAAAGYVVPQPVGGYYGNVVSAPANVARTPARVKPFGRIVRRRR